MIAMSKELYFKSKALGYDYLRDREEISFAPKDYYRNSSYHRGHDFYLYDYLDYIDFDKEKYLEQCEIAFDEFKSSVETNTYKITSGRFEKDTTDDGYNLEAVLFRYETESEFIKRKEKNKKKKISAATKKIREENKRKKEAAELLKEMSPEEIKEAIKGIKGLKYND